MSRFVADFAAGGLPELLYQFGQSATLTLVADGCLSTSSITGRKSPETTRVDTSAGIKQYIRECEFTITTDEDSEYGGLADPEEAVKVTIGSEDWNVVSVKNRAAAYAILSLQIVGVAEVARTGYRGGV